MNAGIDYGLGKTNIDKNGIRYGVIAIHALHEWIYEELEPDYGDPTCPDCGSGVIDSEQGKDYFCPTCYRKADSDEKTDLELFCHYSDECTPDEPLGHYLQGEYTAHTAFDGTCLFLTASPYFTYTKFCSPCAPGAGDLDSPCENGAKTYCFGHEMFDNDTAPYPVYRVDSGELVEPTKSN